MASVFWSPEGAGNDCSRDLDQYEFPSRIAPDLMAIRAFIVDPEASRVKIHPTAELVDKVLDDLEKLMSFRQSPLILVNRWPHSMPQYVLGHEEDRRSQRPCYVMFQVFILPLIISRESVFPIASTSPKCSKQIAQGVHVK